MHPSHECPEGEDKKNVPRMSHGGVCTPPKAWKDTPVDKKKTAIQEYDVLSKTNWLLQFPKSLHMQEKTTCEGGKPERCRVHLLAYAGPHKPSDREMGHLHCTSEFRQPPGRPRHQRKTPTHRPRVPLPQHNASSLIENETHYHTHAHLRRVSSASATPFSVTYTGWPIAHIVLRAQ